MKDPGRDMDKLGALPDLDTACLRLRDTVSLSHTRTHALPGSLSLSISVPGSLSLSISVPGSLSIYLRSWLAPLTRFLSHFLSPQFSLAVALCLSFSFSASLS